MVNYRRNKTNNPEDYFFLTIVTRNRNPRFDTSDMRDLALTVLKRISKRFDCSFPAWAILPDHIHLLMKPGTNDYSKIVYSFKKGLSMEFKNLGILLAGQKMWQDRFWEETIKDDTHYARCMEYIHYNPVKHGYVRSSADWKHTSLHGYIRKGIVPEEWGDGGDIVISGAEYD